MKKKSNMTLVGAFRNKNIYIDGDVILAKEFSDIFALGMKSIEILEKMKLEIEQEKILHSKKQRNVSTRKTKKS